MKSLKMEEKKWIKKDKNEKFEKGKEKKWIKKDKNEKFENGREKTNKER